MWEIALSTGTGFCVSTFTFQTTPDFQVDDIVVGDYNGDGRSDILHTSKCNGVCEGYALYYSSGLNFHYEIKPGWYKAEGIDKISLGDYNGDGRADVMYQYFSGNPSYAVDIIQFKKNGTENLLERVKDGFERSTSFSYSNLTNGTSIYTRGNSSNQYPVVTVTPSLKVVSAISASDGLGSSTTTSYLYEGAKIHRAGLGFMGFKKQISRNTQNDVRNEIEFDLCASNYIMRKTRESTFLHSSNQLVSQSTYDIECQTTVTPSFFQKVKQVQELNALTGATTTTDNVYDANGNITQSTVNVNNIETVTSNTTYIATGTNNVQRPSLITETRTRGSSTSTDAVAFTYDPVGRLATKKLHANKPQFDIYTYTYDNFGNVKSESRTGTLVFQTANTSYTYDNKGRFPVSVTNPLGQVATTTWDARWGKPLVETGIDNVRNVHTYDSWGRLLSTEVKYWNTVPAYTITYTEDWDLTSVPNGVFWKKVSHPGRPDTKVWYDRLGRELQTETEHANNQKVYTKKTYNAKGQLLTSSRSQLPSESPITTTYQYNSYGLLSSTSDVYGTTTNNYTYSNGKTTQTVNSPKGQTTTVTDAAGRVLEQTDNGGKTTFTYDSRGNVLTVRQGVITLIANTYDTYGRKISMQDCDAGQTTYTYDIWGRLKSEKDAKGNTHSFIYDVMDRATSRTGPEGITSYQYYGAGNGYANQLHTVTGFNGVNEEYDYDGFGRPAYSKTTIDGKTFETFKSYNNYGDLNNVSYNTGFGYQNSYDANGFLVDVRTNWSSAAGYGSETLFTAGSMNGQGQYLSYTLGNGKTTTKTYDYGFPLNTSTPGIQNLSTDFNIQNGNLMSRTDHLKSYKEDFTYDNLNRLTSSTVSSLTGGLSNVQTFTTTYDQSNGISQGNIISKSDVGNYKYGGFPRHSVKYVDNTPQQISKWKQNITYTPFRKAEKVTETDNLSTSNFEQTFTYDAAYDRVKSVLTQNGTMQQTRYYLGDYEYNLVGNQYIYYVPGGDGLCAIVQYCPSINAKVKEIHYTYTDHLGSIVAVTDETGSLEAKQNFDPWGRFHNPDNWTSYNVAPHPSGIKAWLYRGYTGHEHMPEFSLINMNGRMYDPLLGRMLSPDIYSYGGSQGYNRYSYCFNNPLNCVDPSGDFFFLLPMASYDAKSGWDFDVTFVTILEGPVFMVMLDTVHPITTGGLA